MTWNRILRLRNSGPVFLLIVCCFPAFYRGATAQTVGANPTILLTPGNDLQEAVDAAPAGSTFELQSGLYRMQSVLPKAGDAFIGLGSVTLNGSQLLSFVTDPSGSGNWVSHAVANPMTDAPCDSNHPLCDEAQDLFVDGNLQVPVASQDALRAGTWYFDRSKGRVYLATNPGQHVVELSSAPYAFFGSASGVKISHLTVEKYATAAQHGAIGNSKEGSNWTVSNVEVRWNHGAGVELGPGSTLRDSFVHHNGQLGVAMGGEGCQLIRTEISWNNYAGYLASWEGGGSKFWETTNLLVDSNFVHDNLGPGLWTDTNNVGTIYQNNIVLNNLNEGIKHEVSYQATIKNNVVKGNGNTATTWLWNAQIEIQNSSDADVYGNTVEVPVSGGNGIAVLNQTRGSGSLGPWVAANNKIHDNVITYLGPHGYTGIVDDTKGSSATGNSFDRDRYLLMTGDGKAEHWEWFGSLNWAGFRQHGEEVNGTCCK